jgi:hypothetical protein
MRHGSQLQLHEFSAIHATMAKRRGRSRKSGKRTASGRLSRAYKHIELRDLGTDEMRIKRGYLINGADPQLAASASGILLANGMIDRDQHAAVLTYARLHSLVYGKVWTFKCPLAHELGAQGNEPSESTIAWAQRPLDEMNSRLSLEQRQAVANAAVFGLLPMEFYVRRSGWRRMPEDEENWAALLSGLTALA